MGCLRHKFIDTFHLKPFTHVPTSFTYVPILSLPPIIKLPPHTFARYGAVPQLRPYAPAPLLGAYPVEIVGSFHKAIFYLISFANVGTPPARSTAAHTIQFHGIAGGLVHGLPAQRGGAGELS